MQRWPFFVLVSLGGAAMIPGCGRGEWKPSGDGQTVVNTRTGEIRETATGVSRKDLLQDRLYQDNQRLQQEARALEAEIATLRKESRGNTAQPFGPLTKPDNVISFAASPEYAAAQADRHRRNSETLANLRRLVDAADQDITPSDDTPLGWNHWTTPLRLGKPISEKHRDDFVEWLHRKQIADRARSRGIEGMAKAKNLAVEDYCERTGTVLPPSHDRAPWQDLREQLAKLEYTGLNSNVVSGLDFDTKR